MANKATRSIDGDRDAAYGFLIPYSESEYYRFVKNAEYFYVALVKDRLAGFVLAHTKATNRRFGGEVYNYIERTQQGSYIFVRQICIAPDPEFAGKGIGKALYSHLFSVARDAELNAAFCFIWKRPRNIASEKFHIATGWKEIDTYRLLDKRGVVGIWQRNF